MLKKIFIFLRPIIGVAVLVFLIGYFGAWGFFGLLFAFILYGLFRLFTRWSDYMLIVKSIEARIWGRPLDRVYGKPPKVKIVWKKTK